MDLDNVKTLWQETDRRLESIESMLRQQQRAAQVSTRGKIRSRLRSVRLVLWYEVAFAALAAIVFGPYLADNIGTVAFLAPAAVLQFAAVITLGFAAHQLLALSQIDYTGPVLTIQRQLARLRVMRARSNRLLLLSAPLLWALLIIVVPHGLFGFDVYLVAGLPWVLANLAFGCAVLVVAAVVSRRFRETAWGSGLLGWIGDDVTGRRMAEASAFLDEISEFEAAA